MSEIIKEITPRDVLISEKNKTIKKLTCAQLDIRVMERSDPNLVVGNRATSKDQYGNILATAPVTAKEMLEQKREEVEDYEARLFAINGMLKGLDKPKKN